jgi:hypothetical protein
MLHMCTYLSNYVAMSGLLLQAATELNSYQKSIQGEPAKSMDALSSCKQVGSFLSSKLPSHN